MMMVMMMITMYNRPPPWPVGPECSVVGAVGRVSSSESQVVSSRVKPFFNFVKVKRILYRVHCKLSWS